VKHRPLLQEDGAQQAVPPQQVFELLQHLPAQQKALATKVPP